MRETTAGDSEPGTGEPGTTSDRHLVRRAIAGDEGAWRDLVLRHGGLPWAVARRLGLDHADAADVSQTVWLRLAANIATLRDASRVAPWLATTARRESLRVIGARRREVLQEAWEARACEGPPPDIEVLRTERDCLLWQAFAGLPEHCRQLLRLVAYAPQLTYAEMGRALGLAPNSIGPRKGRCVHRLRARLLASDAFEGAV